MGEEQLLSLGYKIQHIRRVKVILPPLLLIPGGSFLLGSNRATDPENLNDEQPQHQVMVQKFFLAKYPVTVAEYQCAVDDGAVSAPEPEVLVYGRGETDPDLHQPSFLTWEEQQ